MNRHKVYFAVIAAVEAGRLVEPFNSAEFRRACPGFAEGTYQVFLSKHRKGNGTTSELFERVSQGRYKLLRPYKYQDGRMQ